MRKQHALEPVKFLLYPRQHSSGADHHNRVHVKYVLQVNLKQVEYIDKILFIVRFLPAGLEKPEKSLVHVDGYHLKMLF